MKRSRRMGYLTSIVTCLTVILMFSILNYPVYVSGQTTATVSGRVVDEYKQGMESVEIKVYSSGGAYVKNGTTYSNGSFAIDLETGKSYVLYISKEGYAEVTKSVSLTGNVTFNLGDIVLLKALKLSSTILSRVASPGDKPTLSFTVSNTGKEPETVKFLITKPEGWSARIMYQSVEVTRVYVSSAASISLQMEVTVPLTATGNNSLSLTAVGKTNSTLEFMVEVRQAEEEIKIIAKFSEVKVEAGKIVQYPITIVNKGLVDRLLVLSVDAPADWKVVFKSGALEVSLLYLEAGKSESLVVDATPPSTVDIGTYTIPVQFKSEEGATYNEMKLKATITGSYALSLAPSTLLTSVTTGGSTTFTAKITNTGYTSVTGVCLDISAPSGWEMSTTPIRVDLLKPKESTTFTVVVKTPGDTVAGDYLLTLTGSSDKVNSDSVQVRVTATTPTSWGLIGVGVAAVMVIALLAVFRRFKRR